MRPQFFTRTRKRILLYTFVTIYVFLYGCANSSGKGAMEQGIHTFDASQVSAAPVKGGKADGTAVDFLPADSTGRE